MRRTHIIVVSSDAQPAIVEAAMNSGADDFFSHARTLRGLAVADKQ
jgi:DNA-binding NarL/FixJ family response regulator